MSIEVGRLEVRARIVADAPTDNRSRVSEAELVALKAAILADCREMIEDRTRERRER